MPQLEAADLLPARQSNNLGLTGRYDSLPSIHSRDARDDEPSQPSSGHEVFVALAVLVIVAAVSQCGLTKVVMAHHNVHPGWDRWAGSRNGRLIPSCYCAWLSVSQPLPAAASPIVASPIVAWEHPQQATRAAGRWLTKESRTQFQRSAFITGKDTTQCRSGKKGGRRRALDKSEVRAPSSMEEARRRLLHRAKMKSLMITVVIVAAFIICWTPSTAMINPLIYGVFHLRHQRPSRGSRQFNSSAASRAVDHSTLLLAGSLNKAPATPVASATEPQCDDDSAIKAQDCCTRETTIALRVGNGCLKRTVSYSSSMIQHRKEKRRETEAAQKSHTG
ncbi:hypothetical protein MRX96_034549 [Rhipicephalus microplus]